jgi:tetratricopeptide (TPR) repeat protein/predicted Ser/Thr protein kinase
MPPDSPHRPETNGTPEVPFDAALAEQRRDWLAGKRTPVADRLRRYPALAADPARAAELVFHEFLLRQELGESPDWEDYLRQFPGSVATLGRLRAADQFLVQALAPDAPPGCPATPFGDYELLGELGRGGMGVVYQARQRSLGRLVALKVIRAGEYSSEEERRRFDDEARAVACLQHPHIVQIYERGESDGRPFFAMEYVEGLSLARRLDGTPWPNGQAAELIEVLARVMQYAHAKGIVHRDLKPANVLLTADGRPKVTDFGLAKRLDGQSRGTPTGTAVGTPSYMAPEQARGQPRQIGLAADVYALGAILYELLTGRPPFKGATPLETAVQVLNEEPVRPGRLRAGLPRDLETICLKCLEKDARKRFHSAEDLADDLHRFREGRPVRARPVGLAGRGWRWCRRRPAVAALLAVVVLIAASSLAGFVHLYGQAVAAWHREEAARQKAEDRDWRTRQILAEFVRPNRQPSLQSAESRRRRSLAQLVKAAENYEAFLREKPDDVTLQTTLADVYEGASSLHYEPGQLADALAFGEKALGLGGPEAEAVLLFSVERHRLSTFDVLSGGNLIPNHEHGRFADALAFSEKALALWKRVAEAHPRSPEYRASLAEAYLAKGFLHQDGGEVDQALWAFRHACAVWQALADERPTPERRYNLARAQHLLSEVLHAAGRTGESIRLLADCQALLRRLHTEQPGEKWFLIHLAQNYFWLGCLHGGQGFQAEALGYLQQAYDLVKERVGQRPGDATARYTLGFYAFFLIRPEAVEPYYAEAVASCEAVCKAIARRLEEEPSNQGLRLQLEWLYTGLALCHSRGGQPARRVEVWERYTQLLERLAKQNPEAVGLRLDLGKAYGDLAVSYAETGYPQKAERAAQQGFDILEALRPEDGPHATADLRFQWANQAWGLAHLIRQGGSPTEALRLAEASQHQFLQLVRESPQDLRYALGLYRASEEIGKAHVALDRPDEALTAWLSGVEVMRRVVEQTPSRLGYRIVLANRCLNLSRHLRERCRLSEAADWLLERENLLPADAANLRLMSQEFTLLAAEVGHCCSELSTAEQAERRRYLRLSARTPREIPSWVPPR